MTVIVLTSGTTWNIPGDWTNTNLFESFGGGASGNGGHTAAGGGGSGGYGSEANVTGLSGTLNMAIAAAVSASSANGGVTWIGGTNQATSICSANGGTGGLNTGPGGAGATTTGCTGSTQTAGANGGTGANAGGGGGGGCPGPDGSGATGGSGNTNSGGAGGGGDNGSGGTSGTGGTSATPNGGAGGSNNNGGGGGGGGANISGTGGAGGLPGGGGGGSRTTQGGGAGGQVRITYTPVATNAPGQADTPWWIVPDNQITFNLKTTSTFIFDGWQWSPIAADNLLGFEWTDFPPSGVWSDKRLWFIADGWQRSPIAKDNAVAFTNWSMEMPTRRLDEIKARWIFDGWVQEPRSLNNAVAATAGWTDGVPRVKDQTDFIYRGWQQYELVQASLTAWFAPSDEVPPGLNPRFRWIFDGWTQSPRPANNAVALTNTFTDIPRGVDRYDRFTVVAEPMAPQVPAIAPVFDVPTSKHYDMRYDGWSVEPPLPNVQPPLSSSRSFDLPLARDWKLWWLYQGEFESPGLANVVPGAPRVFMPLMGVGSQGP